MLTYFIYFQAIKTNDFIENFYIFFVLYGFVFSCNEK